MKKRNVLLSVFISLLLLTGCAGDEKNFFFGGQQDPLSEKDNAMGDGTQKPEPAQGTKPLQSDAVRIDTVDFYSFLAGQAAEFKINARVLIPDYQYELKILNMVDFPGAAYDAATGTFAWTPTENFVASTDLYKDVVLQVEVIATKPNNVVLMGSRNVAVRVNRTLKSPDIVSAAFYSTALIREGSSYPLNIFVNDPTATADQATWPTLMIGSTVGTGSMTEYVKITARTRLSNGQIQYAAYLDLTQAEVTKSATFFNVAFKAVSAFNQVSVEKVLSFNVYNKLSLPVSTWTQILTATAGTKLDYGFLVMDPKSEGNLALGYFYGLPTGVSQPTCTTVTPSVKSCQLTWNIPATEVPSTISITNDATLSSTTSDPTGATRQSFTYRLTVQAPPPPQPEGDLK